LQRDGPEVRGIVDEDVQAAERPENLQGDAVNVIFYRDITHDTVGTARIFLRDSYNTLGPAGDERHIRSAADELTNQREPQAGGASGNGDSFARKLQHRTLP